MFSPSHLLKVEQQSSHPDPHLHPKPGTYPQRGTSLVSPPGPTLRADQPSHSFAGWQHITSFWQRVSRGLTMRSHLSIQKITNARRDCWWHVSDPRTGKSYYAETFNEAVDWIEAHRLGK